MHRLPDLGHRRWRALLFCFGVHVLILAQPARGQMLAGPQFALPNAVKAAPPIRRQAGDASAEMEQLAAASIVNEPYVVDHVVVLGGSLLITQKLIFKPGGELILTGARGGDSVKIRAGEIIVEGPGAGIFWNRPSASAITPADRGKAPDGVYGRVPGSAGGPGLDGEPGNVGVSGSDSVSLVLLFKDMQGGPLNVDLRGAEGGPGGRGQDGGNGGAGAEGAPARANLFGCSAGPGTGGDGGPGGKPGDGGAGGAGGAGGVLLVITPDINNAESQIHAYVDGGARGSGGQPGNPGKGGPGGPEGETAPPFCTSANRHGRPGSDNKAQGLPGPSGQDGITGSFFTVPLSDANATTIFSSP